MFVDIETKNNMTRYVFNYTRKGQADADDAKEDLVGLMSCNKRVAEFLDITNSPTIPTGKAKRKRKEYEKAYIKKDGSRDKVTVKAGERDFYPSNKPLAQKVILTTGAQALKTNQTLSLTASSGMTVGQIAEMLAEIIPDTKIKRSGTPTATDIYPQFKLKGGRLYPIPLKAVAEASANVNVPDTADAADTAIGAAETKQPKPKVNP